MELQHRQQSQDHKGWCERNLSLTLISFFSKQTLFSSLVHIHGQTHQQVTHFHLHSVITLSSLFRLSVLFVSIPYFFLFSPPYHSFSHPISLSLLSPPAHLGSNIKQSLKKNKANRNKANNTHTRTQRHRQMDSTWKLRKYRKRTYTCANRTSRIMGESEHKNYPRTITALVYPMW